MYTLYTIVCLSLPAPFSIPLASRNLFSPDEFLTVRTNFKVNELLCSSLTYAALSSIYLHVLIFLIVDYRKRVLLPTMFSVSQKY